MDKTIRKFVPSDKAPPRPFQLYLDTMDAKTKNDVHFIEWTFARPVVIEHDSYMMLSNLLMSFVSLEVTPTQFEIQVTDFTGGHSIDTGGAQSPSNVLFSGVILQDVENQEWGMPITSGSIGGIFIPAGTRFNKLTLKVFEATASNDILKMILSAWFVPVQ